MARPKCDTPEGKKPKAWQKREIGLMLHDYGCFGHKIYTYGAFTLDVKSNVK
jgi:hypothetical protein